MEGSPNIESSPGEWSISSSKIMKEQSGLGWLILASFAPFEAERYGVKAKNFSGIARGPSSKIVKGKSGYLLRPQYGGGGQAILKDLHSPAVCIGSIHSSNRATGLFF
jgi:hypothetical protein